MPGRAGRTEPGGEALVCMSRARMKLEPGERLLLACTARTRRRSCPPCCGRSAAVLAAATVVALLARSSAPHGVRLALDLLVAGVRRARRAALHARRLAVGSHAARTDDAPRLRRRPARRRAARLADDVAGRHPQHRRQPQLRRAPARLWDAHARRRAAGSRRPLRRAMPSASPRRSSRPAPHGRTWVQNEGPAVSDQPAPHSRLA